jgi:hypothetical protein
MPDPQSRLSNQLNNYLTSSNKKDPIVALMRLPAFEYALGLSLLMGAGVAEWLGEADVEMLEATDEADLKGVAEELRVLEVVKPDDVVVEPVVEFAQ